MKQALVKGLYRLWGWLPLPGWLRWPILWMGNQKFLVGVSAVVIDDLGRVLLFKHTYRPEMPWGLPGGWLKKHEDPAHAVVREIKEESGLIVEVLRPLLSESRERYAQLDLVFVARPLGGVFTPSIEVSEAGFFARNAFPALYLETYSVVDLALASLRGGEDFKSF